MGALLTKNPNCVSLVIDGELGYAIWQTLRDARVAAQETHLPLRIDVSQCQHGDLAGVGSLLLAQEQLGTVALSGCSAQFAMAFSAFGICAHCAEQTTNCPMRGAAGKSSH